ncbi:MAG: hypothetical protein CR972_02800 [Candidatus Moraniibacteriota bacterium]|nr:MAG: hypothetical protein CR972_02800 [Candidatus Moranbacteria bacterium]
MKKSQITQLYPWSAEYVIAHAAKKSKRGRGRNPSTPYRGIRNPRKALELAKKMAKDKEFTDYVITSVNTSSITTEDGWSFYLDEKWGVSPRIGDIARFYGEGIGRSVRGLDINGVECFYSTKQDYQKQLRTKAEEHEKEMQEQFERDRSNLDERFNKLPHIFQKRIEKFRKNNPDFRWKYEKYELFCCEQAIVIYNAINTKLQQEAKDDGLTVEQYQKKYTMRVKFLFHELSAMSFEEQKEVIPELEDNHSGNTFGTAMKLAFLYTFQPDSVAKLHGAMAPLVGSQEYGCVPAC